MKNNASDSKSHAHESSLGAPSRSYLWPATSKFSNFQSMIACNYIAANSKPGYQVLHALSLQMSKEHSPRLPSVFVTPTTQFLLS